MAHTRRSPLHLFATIAVLLIVLFGAAAEGRAQNITSINGTVYDTSKAAVPHAKITLINLDTRVEQAVEGNAAGEFVFMSLLPGRYSVHATAPAFQAWEQNGIELLVGQVVSINPYLSVASANTSITVADEPAQIATSSSNISTVIETDAIEELPLDGRNALQLVSLAPGVVETGTGGQFGATQTGYASSGGRDIDVNYTLDGGYNMNSFYSIANPYPNPDALKEFSVDSRNYSARFGLGSTDVAAVTRSGTNSIHGSIFEFLRNNALDAKPYFAASVPRYRRNQFGGTIGGPIKKESAFFFLSYQGTEQYGSPGISSYTTVPMAQRAGDFSALAKKIVDPVTKIAFPGNKIPLARQSPRALAFYQKYLPAPNQGDTTYQMPNPSTLSEHQGVAKVDYRLTTKNFAFVRYFMDDTPQVAYGAGNTAALSTDWLADLPTRFQNTTIGDTHSFAPGLVNEFRVNYTRTAFGITPRTDFSLQGLGYPVNIANAGGGLFNLPPQAAISVSGAFSGNTGSPTRDVIATTQVADSVSWLLGKNDFDIGFELFRNRINQTQNYYTGGNMSFNGSASGVAAADFLLDRFSSFTEVAGVISHLHQLIPDFYIQDRIKVSRTLTLNAGVRWDIARGYTSENGQLSTFSPGQQSTVFPLAPNGMLFPGDAGVPKSVAGSRWNNIAPRVGFAWDVRGDGKTSLRSGFGIYYVPLKRGISLNRLALIQPYTLSLTISGGDATNIFAAAPFNGVNPFPRPAATDMADLAKLAFQPTANLASLQKDMKSETSYEWSLSLQQALWTRSVMEVDYVGSSSSHLTASYEGNPAHYVPGNSTTSNTQARRTYPNLGTINTIANNMSANYHSLQASINQRTSHHLMVRGAFTWSKALGVATSQGEGANGPRDPNNFRRDYGPLSSDATRVFTGALIWSPFDGIPLSHGLYKALIHGWQASGIVSLRSGFPLSLLSGADNSFTGLSEDTPDVIGSWQEPGGRSKADQMSAWFNKAAFKTNAVGTFGTLSRGALRNPGNEVLNINAQKNFAIREWTHGEFRASFYNALNHTNLGGATGTLTSANFGKIITAGNPRVMEFGLRFRY